MKKYLTFYILSITIMIIYPNVSRADNQIQSKQIIPTESIKKAANDTKKPNPPLHPYLMQENYRFPINNNNQNLDLNVDGFYEVKWSGRDYTIPDSTSENDYEDKRYETIINDPIYNKIPKDVLPGPIKNDQRYKIKIDGQVNDYTLHYDLEQEPDLPGKYDIQIKHKNKELTIFHYDVDFKNGAFIDTKKAMDGIKYQQSSDHWQSKFATGAQRSEPKKFETFGNGTNTYNFANSFILPGSVRVLLDNKKLQESVDYEVDELEGKITFLNKIPEKNNYIKIIYEFTNPIADFIPVLNKKNFNGLDFHYKSKDKVRIERQFESEIVTLWSKEIANKLHPDPLKDTPKTISSNILTELIALLTSSNAQTSTNITDITHATGATINITTKTLTQPINSSSNANALNIAPNVSNNRLITPPKLFYVDNLPILMGSDKLYLNNKTLKRHQDYFIDTSTGKITLLIPFNHHDTIDIHFNYYKTTYIEEDLLGKNIAGPYQLENRNIVNNSTSITLDQMPLEELTDYIIDYDEGLLFFNYAIPYPTIINIKYNKIETLLVTENVRKKPYEFGFTYLNESSKSPEKELIKEIKTEVKTISNQIINTTFYPLINTENIKIRLKTSTSETSEISTQDYRIISAYKGKIELNNNTYNNEPIEIDYNYQKSFYRDFSFKVNESRLVFDNNIDSELDFKLNPESLPIQYNSIKKIEYTKVETNEKYILTEGPDFSVEYKDNGQNIIIKFKTNIDEVSAQLDQKPQKNDIIKLYYHYTPEVLAIPDINIDVYGVNFTRFFNNNWSINGDLALAKNNFARPQIQLNEPIIITGSGIEHDIYLLKDHNTNKQYKDIVENSEVVYINDIVQEKNTNYTFNYTKGTIKFNNQNPSPMDTIKILFNYYDLSGLTISGQNSAIKKAFKVAGGYNGDQIKQNISVKKIDREFRAISPIKDKKGATIFNSDSQWIINPKDSMKVNYQFSKQDRGEKKDGEETDRYYLKEHNTALKYTDSFVNFFDTDHELSYLSTVEDPNTIVVPVTGNVHNIDKRTWSLSNTISFGPDNLRNTFSRNYSEQKNDYIDNVNPDTNKTKTYSYKITAKTEQFPLLKNVTFIPNYNNSLTHNTNKDGYSFRKTHKYGYYSQTTPFKSLNITIDSDQTKVIEKSSKTSNEKSFSLIQNKTQSANYSPGNWLSSSYNHSLQETKSPLLNQAKNINETTKYTINKINPYNFFISSGISPFNFWIRPIKDSYLSYSHTKKRSQQNNLKKLEKSKSNTFGYNNWMPITGFKLNSFNYSDNKSERINFETTTYKEHNSFNNDNAYNINTIIKPKWPLLKLLSYQFNYSQENLNNEIQKITKETTQDNSFEYDNKLETDKTHNVTLAPLQIKIPFLTFSGVKFLNLGGFSSLGSVESSNTNHLQQTYMIPTDQLSSFFNETTKQTKPTGEYTSEEKEIKISNKTILQSTFSPFNWFSLQGTKETTDYERKSSFTSQKGTTLKDTLNYSLNGNKSWRWLGIKGSLAHNKIYQWISPTTNVTKKNLQETTKKENSLDNYLNSKLDNYINKIQNDYEVTITFTPIKYISLDIGGKFHKNQEVSIKKELLNTSAQPTYNNTLTVFDEQTAKSGIILRPLTALTLSGHINFLRAKDNLYTTDWKAGQKTEYTATFTPIKKKSFSVNIKYNRIYTEGFSFNQLQNQASLQKLNQEAETKIIERNDYVDIGSLDIKIAIPMQESAYIQEFQIIGEGYYKKIQDYNDPQHKEKNEDQNSFSFFGLMIKGTVIF